MASTRRLCLLQSVVKSRTELCIPRWQSFTTSSLRQAEESHLPRVANPSLWRGLVPKSLRREDGGSIRSWWQRRREKQWNPATIFMILSISVGSFAINILALRRETLNFNRKTDAKLGLLREVLQRVKDGEDVDVERLLGTGDPRQEQEWEQVMQELETADMLAQGQKKRDAKKAAREAAKASETEESAREGGKDGRSAHDEDQPRRPKYMM